MVVCGHLCDDLAVLALAACLVPPRHARLRGRDVSRADHEVTKVFAFVAFERVALDHGPEDAEDLGLRQGIYRRKSEPRRGKA